MYLTVYLLLGAPALLGAVGARSVERLSPAAAARVLTAVGVVAGAATLFSLATLAIGGLSRTGEVAALAHPNPAALAATDPVPRSVGAVAAALLLGAAVHAGVGLLRRRREVAALAGVRAMPAAGNLIVIAQNRPEAYALPGRPPRIVVSTGMLRAMPPDERAALLAHEQSHLAHHHHRYTALMGVVTAVNPAMRGLRPALGHTLERWADEDAAAAVSSRSLTARSLARAALAGTGAAGSPTGVLAFLRDGVTARVRALQAAAPVSRWSAAAPAAVALVGTALAGTDAAAALARLLDVLHV